MIYENYSRMKTEEIRDLMKRRGVSIADLADEIGIDGKRIDEAINGYIYLSDTNAIRIMDALESIKKKRGKVPKKT